MGRDLQASLTSQVTDLALQELHRHGRSGKRQGVGYLISHEQPNVRFQLWRQPVCPLQSRQRSTPVGENNCYFQPRACKPLYRITGATVMKNGGNQPVIIT